MKSVFFKNLEKNEEGRLVVAQLVELLFWTPETRGSNPNIDKFYLPIFHLLEKIKVKEKESGNGPCFLKRKRNWMRN